MREIHGKEEDFIHQLTTHFSKINILSIVGIAGTQGAAWAIADSKIIPTKTTKSKS